MCLTYFCEFKLDCKFKLKTHSLSHTHSHSVSTTLNLFSVLLLVYCCPSGLNVIHYQFSNNAIGFLVFEIQFGYRSNSTLQTTHNELCQIQHLSFQPSQFSIAFKMVSYHFVQHRITLKQLKFKLRHSLREIVLLVNHLKWMC